MGVGGIKVVKSTPYQEESRVMPSKIHNSWAKKTDHRPKKDRGSSI